jgi:hypothetical protein
MFQIYGDVEGFGFPVQGDENTTFEPGNGY